MVVRVPLAASDEQLHRIGDANPGWQVEVMDGEIVMSPTNSDAGRRNYELAGLLWLWASRNGFVGFDSSTGFTLPSGDVLCADVALVARDRWNALSAKDQRSYARLAPDIVVELLSDASALRGTRAKCERWIAQGVGFVLLLNPFADDTVETFGIAPDGFPTDWSTVTD